MPVKNRFINSRNADYPSMNPGKDSYVMVYPESYELGNSPVDLNGDEY
jgi:hypothetical protein